MNVSEYLFKNSGNETNCENIKMKQSKATFGSFALKFTLVLAILN